MAAPHPREPLPPAPRARGRFSTRRRLIVAFSAVLAAVVSAFSLQIAALRRMESTFAEMKEHEEQMRLALELEDAVRHQYAYAARFLLGESTGLAAEYDEERARAVDLVAKLAARVDEPDASAWVEDVREATLTLDRILRGQLAEGGPGPGADLPATLERSYRELQRVESYVDRLFWTLKHAISDVRQDLVRLENAAVRWTAGLLVATLVFVAAAVLYLSRSVAEPLARVSAGAAALAAGDLDARIEIDTPDEFGALAADLDAMTTAVKQHQRRVAEAEKLAGIGRLAAGVAHELNNPLQVMIGYLSINRDVPDPRLARQLAAIEEEALRCKRIVEDLLELSRPTVSPAPVDLRAVCDDVVGGLRLGGARATPRLSVTGAAVALGDVAKLRQVVFNLMKNAVEAAGPAGDVAVEVAERGADAEVTVRDSGPGVPEDARPRLFEPFFTTKGSGTGLGLAVSRAIAVAHGGDIELGQGEGGAAFTLRVPRADGRA